jgi:phosphoglycolate phosphatase-like HAD superfamily hydrolase
MKTGKSFLFILFVLQLSITSCVQKRDTNTDENLLLDTIGEKQLNNPLPSWNDTKTKNRIIDFVKTVTTKDSSDYIEQADRIAVLDDDGTLWSEKPTYFQIEFILYRIKQLAPSHPKWEKDKLIKTAIKHDLTTLRKKYGVNGLGKLMAIAQSGMTTAEFEQTVQKWIKKARHPITGKLFSEMTFQPMLELIEYLKSNDFKVYIVSGGGIDFMRAWTKDVYGIPKEQVIGSYQELEYKKINGKPVLVKLPDIIFIDDKDGKVKAIHRVIGKKPVIAFGNSDGDLQMLEWCSANKYKSLSAFIHHTDAKREWAYDRNSPIGQLNMGLDEAAKKGWLVVDMKKDWKYIHPYELNEQVAAK